MKKHQEEQDKSQVLQEKHVQTSEEKGTLSKSELLEEAKLLLNKHNSRLLKETAEKEVKLTKKFIKLKFFFKKAEQKHDKKQKNLKKGERKRDLSLDSACKYRRKGANDSRNREIDERMS